MFISLLDVINNSYALLVNVRILNVLAGKVRLILALIRLTFKLSPSGANYDQVVDNGNKYRVYYSGIGYVTINCLVAKLK